MLEIINIPWTQIALGLYIAALIVGGLLFLRECEAEEAAPLEEEFDRDLDRELINFINKDYSEFKEKDEGLYNIIKDYTVINFKDKIISHEKYIFGKQINK